MSPTLPAVFITFCLGWVNGARAPLCARMALVSCQVPSWARLGVKPKVSHGPLPLAAQDPSSLHHSMCARSRFAAQGRPSARMEGALIADRTCFYITSDKALPGVTVQYLHHSHTGEISQLPHGEARQGSGKRYHHCAPGHLHPQPVQHTST